MASKKKPVVKQAKTQTSVWSKAASTLVDILFMSTMLVAVIYLSLLALSMMHTLTITVGK